MAALAERGPENMETAQEEVQAGPFPLEALQVRLLKTIIRSVQHSRA